VSRQRPYTPAEREEVYRLRLKGRLGTLSAAETDRIAALYAISPEGYGEAVRGAREEADASVNPLARERKP